MKRRTDFAFNVYKLDRNEVTRTRGARACTRSCRGPIAVTVALTMRPTGISPWRLKGQHRFQRVQRRVLDPHLREQMLPGRSEIFLAPRLGYWTVPTSTVAFSCIERPDAPIAHWFSYTQPT
jgi:hypothetical protein